MKRELVHEVLSLTLLGGVLFLFCPVWALGASKIQYATSTKTSAMYVLPILAAEEKGFFKEQGLEVDWVPSEQAEPMFKAMTGGHIDMASAGATSVISAIARGVPAVLVADLGAQDRHYIWVQTTSPVQEAKDLKGKRIAITRYGGLIHAYGVTAIKSLGLEKEVKIVATGGTHQSMAALKAGVVDGIVQSFSTMVGLKFTGQVRGVVLVQDFLPKKWVEVIMLARTDFWEKKPELVRAIRKAVLQAAAFVLTNPPWVVEKMKALLGHPEPASLELFKTFQYSKDGKIDPESLENVRRFLIQYDLIKKAPTLDKIYLPEFGL